MKLKHVHHWTFDKLICAINIICLAVVLDLVLVLKDSLGTYFKSLSLSLSLSLGVRFLSLSLGVRSLSWSLVVRSLLTSLWRIWTRTSDSWSPTHSDLRTFAILSNGTTNIDILAGCYFSRECGPRKSDRNEDKEFVTIYMHACLVAFKRLWMYVYYCSFYCVRK